MSKITIVGAGAAGATLALFLRNEGHDVSLYDGRPDSRQIAGPAYRTIAVTLSERGMGIFRRLNLENQVLRQSMVVTGRVMHGRTGEEFVQKYSANGDTLQCVARIDLDQLLLDAVERMGDIKMHFLHDCVSIDLPAGRATFKDKQGGQLKEVESDYVIGADGATSLMRQKLAAGGAIKPETISFSGGYKEFLIPAAKNGSWIFPPGFVHIWPRGEFTFIAFPALRGEFIAMLFMPATGSPLKEGEERELIQRDFVDLDALAPHVADRCENTTLVPLRRVRVNPWVAGERFALIGDAAHAILPFYGQGMNASLEDCEVLAKCMARGSKDPSPLTRFQQSRKPNADAIDELAEEHYHYLTTFSETPESIRKKEIESELYKQFPNDFTPLYTLVAFSALSYAKCQRIGNLQSQLLDRLAKVGPQFSWEIPAVKTMLDEYRKSSRQIREEAN
jgi:kynurenine 3-monooxygenase